MAVPTKLGVADVLLACKVANHQRMTRDADEDAIDVVQKLAAQIVSKWNVCKDDINERADSVIVLADLVL